MYLRIVSYKDQLLLYCHDGSTVYITDDILHELFVNFRNPKKFCGIDERWNAEFDSRENAPGQTLAYINNKMELCIVDSNPFAKLISDAI